MVKFMGTRVDNGKTIVGGSILSVYVPNKDGGTDLLHFMMPSNAVGTFTIGADRNTVTMVETGTVPFYLVTDVRYVGD